MMRCSCLANLLGRHFFHNPFSFLLFITTYSLQSIPLSIEISLQNQCGGGCIEVFYIPFSLFTLSLSKGLRAGHKLRLVYHRHLPKIGDVFFNGFKISYLPGWLAVL